MTKEIARITRDGDFMLNGIMREGVCPIESNLVHDFDFMSDHLCDRHNDYAMAAPEETIMRADNLLDAMGMDWRDPNAWGNFAAGKIKYNAKDDCLDITGGGTAIMRQGIPILHNRKFNISCEIWHSTVTDSTKKPIFYLGGMIFAADGTTNLTGEQIPGTYDYLGASGVQSLSGWTHYHNTHATGQPRTGTNGNKTEPSWVSTASRYYRPLMLPNYRSIGANPNDVMKVRNLRYWYSDDDDTGKNLMTGAGVNIMNAGHKNYVSVENVGTSGAVGHNNSRNRAIISPAYPPDGSTGTKWSCMSSNISPGEWDGVSSGWATEGLPNTAAPAGGEWWSASMLIRSSDWARVASNMMYILWRKPDGKGGALGVFNTAHRVSVGDGWYLCYGSALIPQGCTVTGINSYTYGGNDTYSIEFGRANLVKGRNLISLPPSTTTVADQVTTKVRSLDTFTIMGKFANCRKAASGVTYTDGIADSAILFSLKANDGKWCHFRFYISGVNPMPYIDGDVGSYWNTSTSNQHAHNRHDFAEGENLYWVVKHTKGDALYVQFYHENGDKTSADFTLPANILSSSLKLEDIVLGSGSNAWQGIHSELKVFNAYLDNAKTKDMIKTRFVVEDGETREFYMESRDVDGMIDVDMSPYDKHRYGEGWASVVPTTSFLPENSMHWPSRSIGGEYVTTPYGHGIKITGHDHTSKTHTGNTTSGNYRYVDIPASNFVKGDKITTSVWVYVSPDWDGGTEVMRYERAASNWSHFNPDLKGKWQLVSIPVLTWPQTTTPLRVLTYNSLWNGTNGYIIMADARTVKHSRPSIKSEANSLWDGKMKFNLHKDYKLDQREDWTISYWKKPIAGHDGGAGGYTIDSLGYSNGKRSDGSTSGYCWWGKNAGKDEIAYSSPIPNMSDYWDNWRLVVLSHKKGDGLYVTEIDKTKTYTRKITGSLSHAEYFTTITQDSNGIDLQLGGWHTGRYTAIFRDIKFGRVHKTQQQAELMFKEGLRVTKAGISINGEVVESNL